MRYEFKSSSITSTSVGFIRPLKIETQSIWPSNMPAKATCFTSSEERSIWAKIRHSISLFKCVQVFTICTNKALSIVTLSRKTSLSRKVISSKYVILDGAFRVITASKELLFAARLSTWLLRWYRTKLTITRLTCGPWVFCSTNCAMEELHLPVRILEKSATKSCAA